MPTTTLGRAFCQTASDFLFVETRRADNTASNFDFKVVDFATGNVVGLAPESGGVHVRHAVAPDGRSGLMKRQGGAFYVIPLDQPKWSWEQVPRVPGLEEPDVQRMWSPDGAAYLASVRTHCASR